LLKPAGGGISGFDSHPGSDLDTISDVFGQQLLACNLRRTQHQTEAIYKRAFPTSSIPKQERATAVPSETVGTKRVPKTGQVGLLWYRGIADPESDDPWSTGQACHAVSRWLLPYGISIPIPSPAEPRPQILCAPKWTRESRWVDAAERNERIVTLGTGSITSVWTLIEKRQVVAHQHNHSPEKFFGVALGRGRRSMCPLTCACIHIRCYRYMYMYRCPGMRGIPSPSPSWFRTEFRGEPRQPLLPGHHWVPICHRVPQVAACLFRCPLLCVCCLVLVARCWSTLSLAELAAPPPRSPESRVLLQLGGGDGPCTPCGQASQACQPCLLGLEHPPATPLNCLIGIAWIRGLATDCLGLVGVPGMSQQISSFFPASCISMATSTSLLGVWSNPAPLISSFCLCLPCPSLPDKVGRISIVCRCNGEHPFQLRDAQSFFFSLHLLSIYLS
jgi:hypothetical protein